jgi:hypothetical protein
VAVINYEGTRIRLASATDGATAALAFAQFHALGTRKAVSL